MPLTAQATIRTVSARRYLGQFCKHFAHKLPVDLAATNETGEVTFGSGTCSLEADDVTLRLKVEATLAQDIATLQDVVARHLTRFAFREDLALTWQRLA